MRKDLLQIEFYRLMKDVSDLPDTTSSRYSIDEYGTYHLTNRTKVSSKEERTKRVLGAIYSYFPAQYAEDDWHKTIQDNLQFYKTSYHQVIEALKNDDRKCVTDNFDVRLILLLLRYEGVIEFGKTPLCSGKDPKKYLDRLISSSGIPYKDTLLKLLDEQSEKLFIDYDPDETEADKVNRAVMLLSLLSPEEIREYSMKDMGIWWLGVGPLCWFFDDSVAPFTPLLLIGSDKANEILRNAVLKMEIPSAKLIDKMIEHYGIPLTEGPVAVGSMTYKSILRQCAVSGISCEGWLFKVDYVYGISNCPPECNRFIFEHLNNDLVERIYDEDYIRFQCEKESGSPVLAKKPGRYLIVLDETDFQALETNRISDVVCEDFRQSIAQRADLRSIGKGRSFEYTDGTWRRYYLLHLDFDLNLRTDDTIKVINCDNIDADSLTDSSLIEAFVSRESGEPTLLYNFVSPSTISHNYWRLNPDLYWTKRLSEMRYPTRLDTILSRLNLEKVVMLKSRERVRMCALYDLLGNPLDNYREQVSPEVFSSDHDEVFYELEPWPSAHGILLVAKNSPADYPSYFIVPEDEPLYIHKGLADHCYFFEVKDKLADPWFLAYCISGEEDQCRIRLTDGTECTYVPEKDFLTIMVDLPPIDEQVRSVETILKEDLMRRRSQLGVAEALLNLSHTIGSPSNRIQTLLGELEEILDGNDQAISALRKIGDNFDYIVRLVNTFSRDFEKYPVILKSTPVVPLVEKNLKAVANLPLGFTPELVSCTISHNRTAFLDDMLFEVMMDNIFRNAYRHGFNRIASPENKVGVFLSEVSMHGLNHLLMSIRNNGKPLESGFTVHDFILRGKTGVSTGNSGQGGHDIYQIVKKFKGYLSLRSDKEWNFIIDILLPLEPVAGGTGDIELYPYGPLV